MPYLMELAWSRLKGNSVQNVVEGGYNAISVVTLIVYINVKMIKYIPYYIMWL